MRPSGRWKSFQVGTLPYLVFLMPSGEERPVAFLQASEMQCGTNSLADGAEVSVHTRRPDGSSGRLTKRWPSVGEAKAATERFFSEHPIGRGYVKGHCGRA